MNKYITEVKTSVVMTANIYHPGGDKLLSLQMASNGAVTFSPNLTILSGDVIPSVISVLTSMVETHRSNVPPPAPVTNPTTTQLAYLGKYRPTGGDIQLTPYDYVGVGSKVSRRHVYVRQSNTQDVKKIQAIKVARDFTRLPLKESKEFIEGVWSLNLSSFSDSEVRAFISVLNNCGYRVYNGKPQ